MGFEEENTPDSGACFYRLKFISIALVVGAATACIRHVTGFFPVLQGMSAGAAAAGAAGFFLKKKRSSPKERAWLWLNLSFSYTLAFTAVLSFLSAQPFSPPLSWLNDILGGSEAEYYFGAPIFSWGLYGGALSGAGWVILNALDGIFFFFFGLIILGVSTRGAERPPEHSKIRGEKRFFLFQCGIIMLLFLAFSITGARAARLRGSAGGRIRTREELSALEGRYLFSDGINLLGPSGQGGSFIIEVSGYDSVALKSEPENSYYIAISKQGRYFPGRLYRGSSSEKVFLKFFEGGRLLISSRRKSAGGGQTDLILEARRELKIPPGGSSNYPEEER